MRTLNQFLSPLCAVPLFVALLPLARADQIDTRLASLAARAQQRRAWRPLRQLAATIPDAERRGRAYFVLGYREYAAGEFEAASADLRAAAKTGFSLADHARYYWAEAGHEAGQFSQAAEALEDFSSRYPASTLRRAALELLAKSLLTAGQPERAIQVLAAEPQIRRRAELSIWLARSYHNAGKPVDAARIFQEIYYAFPLSAQAEAARAALAQLRVELAERFPETTEEAQTTRAEILAGSSRWQEALDEYVGLLERHPGSPLAPRWQIGRARCLIRLQQTRQAEELLTREVSPTPSIDPERLGLLVEAYIRNADLVAAEIVLDQLRKLYPQSQGYASALAAIGNYYARQGDWKTAARYYQPLAESFPSTDQGKEAQWRLAWSYYLDGDLNRAREGFAEHLSWYPDSDHVTGALYWLARIEEQRGAPAGALTLYGFLRQRYAQSYYAAQAQRRLGEIEGPGSEQGKAPEAIPSVSELTQRLPPRPVPPVRPCAPPTASPELEPFLALNGLGLTELAEQYLLARLEESPDAAELRLTLSRLRAGQGKHALALYDARRAIPRPTEYTFADLPEDFWRLLYPQEFFSLVKRHATANRLDAHLVLGLIRQESAFNPRATSVANARGLMQILPSTVSPSRRGRARAARRLYDPAYNIRFGTRHLRGLLTNFGGIPEQALAAYHAGEVRVRDWLSKRTFQEPAEFLETIPIPSTRAYVEAVLRDAGIYRQLMSRSRKFAKCR